MGFEEKLQALIDGDDIRDLARRYAHCVWQKDADGAVNLFTEDGVMDMGDRAALVGRAAMLESYRATVATAEFRPFVHNHVLEIDGDTATGTVYLDLRAVLEGQAMIGHGYYEDVYVRTDVGWRFKSRALNLAHYVEDANG
jgi:ketosteroid isomerase-like protein